MLTSDELLAEFEKDMELDRSDIQMEVYRTTTLQAKWMRYYYQYKAAMIRAESIMAEKLREAMMYYDGAADASVYRARPFNLELKNQKQKDLFIDSDPDCCAYRERADTAALNLKVCEEMLESLRYRPKHLELVHSVRQFESG